MDDNARLAVAGLAASYVLALIAADRLTPIRAGRSAWAILANAAVQLLVLAVCVVSMRSSGEGLVLLAAGVGLGRNLALWLSDSAPARAWTNAAHLVTLALFTVLRATQGEPTMDPARPVCQALVLVAAFATAVLPAGRWIGHWTSRWASSIPEDDRKMGLPGAGLLIGRIERCLVVLFVLLQRYEAVGFLLAAKSVFRIGDLTNKDERRFAEYIFVGTLLSFTTAIGIGLMALVALGMNPGGK